MKYFFWYYLNTTVRTFNNSNICTVNAIQKKFVYLHEMGEEMKTSLLIKALVQKVYSSFSFHLHTIQLFISPWVKSYEDIYHSPPHVSVITRNILTKIIRFARYHLLASNSTLMADSMYLGTIQICRKLNKNFYYLISITSVIWQIDANCSPFQLPSILPFHIRL